MAIIGIVVPFPEWQGREETVTRLSPPAAGTGPGSGTADSSLSALALLFLFSLPLAALALAFARLFLLAGVNTFWVCSVFGGFVTSI